MAYASVGSQISILFVIFISLAVFWAFGYLSFDPDSPTDFNLTLNPTPQTTPIPEADHPQAVVNSFYDWYMSYEGDPLQSQAYQDSDLLTNSFKDEVDQALEQIDPQTYDPILCSVSQVNDYDTQTSDISGDTAQVEVIEELDQNQRLVPIELVKENERWLINDIACS